MLTVPVSQAAAAQRTGRAGRVKPGKCYRLYTERDYRAFSPRALPETTRAELTPALLTLLALGVKNVAKFDWLDPPAPQAAVRGLELLYATGAINARGTLTTPVGRAMVCVLVCVRE
jgi:ATP-dependent RNA helicase DDX35